MVENIEVQTESKETEVGSIPADWDVLPIEGLTPQNRKYTIVDGPFGSNLKTIHYRKAGIPIITSGFVTDGKFYASEYIYVDLEKFKQEKRSAVKGGDIVMAKIGERCGASAILPKAHLIGILSGNALKITIDENRFSTELIAQILWQHHKSGFFEILRTTGAQPAISMANLKKYKIPLPPTLTEQTAIATALNDADALITQLENLIAKKRAIKQGTMQELLKPKEGWEVKRLGEVVDFFDGRRRPIKDSDRNKMKGKYPYYGASGIIDYVNDYIFNEELILLGEDGENILSRNVRLAFKVMGKIWVNNHAHVLKPKTGFDINYLTEVLESINYEQYNSGTAQPKLNQKTCRVIPIKFPPTFKEQTQIAQTLSDMDSEIELLEKKLAKYKLVKQGMMQNLLTGKIRLV